MREGRDSAKDQSIGSMDEELLFAFAFVLLVPPAKGCGDDARNVGESM